MGYHQFSVKTSGERFYSITEQVTQEFLKYGKEKFPSSQSGLLSIFIPHTSCALTISESYDPAAMRDMEKFLQHLAPRNLAFIEHDDEGPDDSPSHMKSILMQSSLTIFIEDNQLLLGTWGGIFLCEFRDAPKERKIMMKFLPDPT